MTEDNWPEGEKGWGRIRVGNRIIWYRGCVGLIALLWVLFVFAGIAYYFLGGEFFKWAFG